MRLIDADELIKGFDLCINTADDTVSVLIASTFKRIVNKQPTIEPKKGRWIDDCTCSNCYWTHEDGNGFALLTHYSFCPNCGANMRGKQE